MTSSGNQIGGIVAGAGNVIANNGGNGVTLENNTLSGNALLGNRFFNNSVLAIDLNQDGVSLNDCGDGDTGPNNLQNYPVLISASTSGGNTTIIGSLNSAASVNTYRIEFFPSPTDDPTGYGEGQTYLGFVNVTTDGSGNATISTTLTGVSVTAGHAVTATSTYLTGGVTPASTSEFAANVTAAVGVPGITVSANSVQLIGPQQTVSQTDTATDATQLAQAIATGANGNYVVVWTRANDGSTFGVMARLYNKYGVSLGNKFAVNTTTANVQSDASVAMDDAGNFVVVWQSNLQDGDAYGIVARRFNSTGTALGGEFIVNSTTAIHQYAPSVSMDSGGEHARPDGVWRQRPRHARRIQQSKSSRHLQRHRRHECHGVDCRR